MSKSTKSTNSSSQKTLFSFFTKIPAVNAGGTSSNLNTGTGTGTTDIATNVDNADVTTSTRAPGRSFIQYYYGLC